MECALTSSSSLNMSIDIRTFESYEQIRQEVDGFLDNHPISKLTYAQIVGDYNLSDEVRCCFQKENGKLCETEHKRGWVARLKDGTATIIGNHCAEDKFGADSRLISDRSRYINEKKRRERLDTLRQLLEQKDERLGRLAELRKLVMALESRVKVITDPLGVLVQRRLKDMIRTRRTDVAVTAVKNRPYVDAQGRHKTERSTFVQSLGRLAGVDLAARGTYADFHDSINDIVCTYQRAAELAAAEDLLKCSKEVEKVSSKLQAFDRVVQEAERLLSLEEPFFSNNFVLLCFLTDNKEERQKAAKVALRRLKKGDHSGPIEIWLAAQDKAIAAQLDVDSIEIR